MAPIIAILVLILTVIYIMLHILLHLTQNPQEPPTLENHIPFLSPLLGIIREKEKFYIRLRNKHNHPIYTLRLPFSRLYIVNATSLIKPLQKKWLTISFAAIAADAGKLVGMSKAGLEVLHRDLVKEEGFSVSWPKEVGGVMAPGRELDRMSGRAVEVFAAEIGGLRGSKGLWSWTRAVMVRGTTEAVWGPGNPYRDVAVAEAWRTFEAGFLTLSVFPFPAFFFPKLYRARELVAAAMLQYFRNCGHKTASALVRTRYEHHRRFGLTIEDIARGELGNTFAVLGNSTPCALWLLYHIFSDEQVLTDVRKEVEALVREKDGVCEVDLAGIRTGCPMLLSTFQETLRFRAVNPGPRVVLEDVLLDGNILLKKGSMLMIPAPVQHSSIPAWGEDAGTFNHMRFARKPVPGEKRPNRVAFRAFGGGHVLCPGRHFASTEIMALAALLVLQFDVVPVEGKWVEPTWKNSPVSAGFPVPDEDIEVEFRARDIGRKWRVRFEGEGEAMGIVEEDVVRART